MRDSEIIMELLLSGEHDTLSCGEFAKVVRETLNIRETIPDSINAAILEQSENERQAKVEEREA